MRDSRLLAEHRLLRLYHHCGPSVHHPHFVALRRTMSISSNFKQVSSIRCFSVNSFLNSFAGASQVTFLLAIDTIIIFIILQASRVKYLYDGLIEATNDIHSIPGPIEIADDVRCSLCNHKLSI